MENETLYRWILGGTILLLLPVGAYHRFRSHQSKEPLDRRQEGLFILISLRLMGFLAYLTIMLYLFYPEAISWAALALPVWSRWVGVASLVFGAILATWTFRNLGKNLTDTVVTRREHTLVTAGPYRFVRHPFYCAAALGVLGCSLISANALVAGFGACVLCLLTIRTPIEEAKLLERFGEEYADYRKRTGMFFPKL